MAFGRLSRINRIFGCDFIVSQFFGHHPPKIQSKARPELEKMIAQLRKGDTMVVWKQDRLGLSLKYIIELVSFFRDKGVEFISVKDGIDTSTATKHRPPLKPSQRSSEIYLFANQLFLDHWAMSQNCSKILQNYKTQILNWVISKYFHTPMIHLQKIMC